jgi:hypothetical protein
LGAGLGSRTREPDSGAGLGSRTWEPDLGAGLGSRTRDPDSGAGLGSWTREPHSSIFRKTFNSFYPSISRKVDLKLFNFLKTFFPSISPEVTLKMILPAAALKFHRLSIFITLNTEFFSRYDCFDASFGKDVGITLLPSSAKMTELS